LKKGGKKKKQLEKTQKRRFIDAATFENNFLGEGPLRISLNSRGRE